MRTCDKCGARLCSDPLNKGCTNAAEPTRVGGRRHSWCRDCRLEKRRLYRRQSKFSDPGEPRFTIET